MLCSRKKHLEEDKKNFFILSMGHRIQFLEYDASTPGVNVTQYRARQGFNRDEGDNTYQYNYELWVPELGEFRTVSQKFHQFPDPEMRWNKIDHIVLGHLTYDADDNGTRCR